MVFWSSTAAGTIDMSPAISLPHPRARSYAVFLGDGGGTLIVETTADIDGTIRVSDHDVNLTNVGRQGRLPLSGRRHRSGRILPQAVISIPSQGWFVDDEGGSAPVYATYDADEAYNRT